MKNIRFTGHMTLPQETLPLIPTEEKLWWEDFYASPDPEEEEEEDDSWLDEQNLPS